jgi:uncharacterized protein (TIGR04255 family)
MKLPKSEWVQFRKSPLKLVIGQVRFTIMPRFGEASFIVGFQEAIRSIYPKIAREAAVTYQLSPEGIHPNLNEKLWRFSSRDQQWSVVVGEAAITLETRAYNSMKDFLERFCFLLETAKEQLGVSDRLRLGLRYINEVRYPDAENLTDWRTLFNTEFVSFDASEMLGGQVDHTLHEIQVNRSNGVFAVRHGLLKGAVVAPLEPTVQEPAAEGRFYLIDLDYYDLTEQELNIAATIEQMQEYNDVMYRFFRWTLSQKLYSYLEPINA